MLSAIDATMPQRTAGMSAVPARLTKIGEADSHNEERFQPLAQGHDERLQHDDCLRRLR